MIMRILMAVLLSLAGFLPLAAQRNVRSVDTIAAIKTMVPSTVTPDTVVLGRFAIADGAGGVYHWDPASTLTPDDFNVVQSSVNPNGRHLRCFVQDSTPPSQTVATPFFNPVAGTYSSPQSVTITETTAGATIYYTTDGSTPTSFSTAYASPVSISSTTVLKAFATKAGLIDSAVVSGTYTISTSVAGPVFHYDHSNPQTYLFSDDPGFPLTVQWSITDATPSAEIWYVQGDDTAVTPSVNPPSALYSSPGSIGTSYQFKAVGYLSGVYSTVTTSTFAIELPVFWGYSPNTSLTGPQVRALQSSQLRYVWASTIPTFTYGIPAGTYTVGAGSTINDYFYYAWPENYPSPTIITGFFLSSFPMAMAGPADGFTDGPENGWYFQTVEVDTGINYHVFRTANPVGGGVANTIVQ